MKESKKEVIISAIIVIILLISIIAVSYSMFSFSSDSSKENVINTGNVAISYIDKKIISLEGAYPVSDKAGMNDLNNVMEFTLDANISGQVNIKYELGFIEITEGQNLKASNIKFVMYEDDTMIIGSAEEGVLLSNYATKKGDIINSYYLTGGNFSKTGSKNYKIISWIDEGYKFNPNITNNGDNSHSIAVNTEKFSFKVQVKAIQA